VDYRGRGIPRSRCISTLACPGWLPDDRVRYKPVNVQLLMTRSHTNDARRNWAFGKGIILLRIFFVIGVALLVTGSCFVGNYNNPDDVSTGEKLAKAGYLVIACVLAVLVSFTGIIRMLGWAVSTSSIKVFRWSHCFGC
jgi:hypothetical protein